MRFLFLNQFVPPDPAPTAMLLGDVADELTRRGHRVLFIGDQADYRGSKTLLGSRALREVTSLSRLFLRALFAPRTDVIVCLTSPPLLPVIARWVRLRHRRARLIHWAMDLYPDVAVALGEVREGSLLHRSTAAMMGKVYRACDLIVVLDGEMADRVGLHGAKCEVYPLWPPAIPSSVEAENGSAPNDGVKVPFVWLYSGNLGRAHEWRTILDAQHLLEQGGIAADLVFQGGGAEREAAQQHARLLGLKRCFWRPYADEEDLLPSLLAADCLIATQRPETSGCLWPSKLALSLLLDRPILWVGAPGGGVTGLLGENGYPCFAPGESTAVAETIKEFVHDRPEDSARIGLTDLVGRIQSARVSRINTLASRFEEVGS